MEEEIINILKNIEDNGYEAYIVGGYVRDKLLGINSYDVDICTNALPKDLVNIFSNANKRGSIYGNIKIKTEKYRFDITTYRLELSYKGRKPDKIIYINNLLDDLERRDFTINTICMNSNGDIIDLLSGINDLQNKIIKCIKDPNTKFREDPLRMLRALRFSTILDFKLDNSLKKALKKNIKLITNLSMVRIKEEIDKILASHNAIKGLKLLKDYGVLKLLKINYSKIMYVDDLCGMYSMLEFVDEYPFTKVELKNINSIKEIVKSKKINNFTLYEYGLYLSTVAAKILNYDIEENNLMYKNLPIKSSKDLAIKSSDIVTILGIDYSYKIKVIESIIINKILNNELNNDNDELVAYIVNNKDVLLNE